MLPLRRILFATDFSDLAELAYRHAADLARRTGAELLVLHVLPPDAAEEDDERTSLLPAAPPPGVAVRELLRQGDTPGAEIVEAAKAEAVDLVVVGTHGRRGLKRLFLGSVAERIVREAPCAVLTVPEIAPEPGEGRVLAPVDFSDHAPGLVRTARAAAALYGTGLDLLHVVQDLAVPVAYGLEPIVLASPDILDRLQEALGGLAEETLARARGAEASVDVACHVQPGYVAAEVVRFAEEQGSGLIVIATHGLSGLEHFLVGSVTEKVVRTAPCPVLTVRSFGASLL